MDTNIIIHRFSHFFLTSFINYPSAKRDLQGHCNVCLCVCLSVNTITPVFHIRYSPKFVGLIIYEKGQTLFNDVIKAVSAHWYMPKIAHSWLWSVQGHRKLNLGAGTVPEKGHFLEFWPQLERGGTKGSLPKLEWGRIVDVVELQGNQTISTFTLWYADCNIED